MQTLPVPPPRPLADLRREALARLDEREPVSPIFSPSFTARCARCPRPRLSTTSALCVLCECGGLP